MNQVQALPPTLISASRAHTRCRQVSRLQVDGSSRVRLSGGSAAILLVVPAPPGTSYLRCDSLRSATQAPQLLPAATPGSAASNFNKLPDSFPNRSFSWSSILHCSYCRFPTIPPLPFGNLCHPRANEKVLKKKTLQFGTSLAVQWFGTCLAMQGMWVQFLAGELRSHVLWGQSIPCA